MNQSQNILTAASRFQAQLNQLHNFQNQSNSESEKQPEINTKKIQDLNPQDSVQATLPFLSNINLIPHLQLMNMNIPHLNPHLLEANNLLGSIPNIPGLGLPTNPMNPLAPFFSTPEKRQRTVFSINQLDELERVFALQKYVVGIERTELAAKLRLTEAQVKVWFQNRRIKERKNQMGGANSNLSNINISAAKNSKEISENSAYATTKRQLKQENVPIQNSFNHIYQNTQNNCNSTPVASAVTNNTNKSLRKSLTNPKIVTNSPSPVSSEKFDKSPKIEYLKSNIQNQNISISPTSDYSKTWLSYDLIKKDGNECDEVDVC